MVNVPTSETPLPQTSRVGSYNFKIPTINSTVATFYYNASKEWNSVTPEQRAIDNKTYFKQELKKYLFTRAEQRVRDLLSFVFYLILSRINNMSN